MFQNSKSNPLNKISSTINAKDREIWENVAHSICIKRETEKLNNEIARLKKTTAEMEKEDNKMEAQLEELKKSLLIQQETIHLSQRSIINQLSLKESLNREVNEFRKIYATTLQDYSDELQEYRSMYENSSKSYKELNAKQIELKKIKIKYMDLETRIKETESSRKQYENIKKQIFQSKIVKFAEFYVLYHKNIKLRLEMEDAKREENQLLKQHLELVEEVKFKQRHQKLELNKRSDNLHQINTNNVLQMKNEEKQTVHYENNKGSPAEYNKELSSAEKLKQFLSEDFQPFTLSTLDSLTQKPKFTNAENSKVRILDVKVVKPFPQEKTSQVKKFDTDSLRKKMENIIETTQKNILRSNSFQFGSQGSQKNKLSQQSQERINGTPSNSQTKTNLVEKSSTLKENNTFINPILKQQKDNKKEQENVSKFFSGTNKKSVTFQTEDKNIEKNKVSPFKPEQFEIFDNNVQKEKTSVTMENASTDNNIFRKPFSFKTEQPSPRQNNFPFDFFNLNKSGDGKSKQHEMSDSGAEAVLENSLVRSPPFGNSLADKTISDDAANYPFDMFNGSFVNDVFGNYEPAPTSMESTPILFGSQKSNNVFSLF